MRRRIAPDRVEMGRAHNQTRDPLYDGSREVAGERLLQFERHGRGGVVGLLPYRGHGCHSVLDAHACRHRARLRRAPDPPGCGRHSQGAAAAGAGAAQTPLSQVHIENMLKLARMGVAMLPPVPAFYNHPRSIEDIVDHIVARVLDQFNIAAPFAKRWDGHMEYLAKKEALRAVAAVPASED